MGSELIIRVFFFDQVGGIRVFCLCRGLGGVYKKQAKAGGIKRDSRPGGATKDSTVDSVAPFGRVSR